MTGAGRTDAPRPDRPTTIDDVLRASGGRRDLQRLPALVGRAFHLVWLAARRELLVAGALQVVAGLGLAAQLLVARRLLERLLADGRVPDWPMLVPDLVWFGTLLVLVGVAAVAQREQQRTLSAHVEKYTTARVLDVSTSVDLIEYDRPTFYDRLQRARINASVRPLQISNGVIGLIGGIVAVAAIGTTLLLIEPAVVALIVVGSIPSLLLNRVSSRLLHVFSVRQTPGDRRRAYLYQVLSRKEEAQEVRAFDSYGYLRAQHEHLYDEKIEDLRGVVRRRLLYGALTAVIVGSVTVLAVSLLIAFVRSGRISISDAGVAVGAVLLLAGQIRGLIGSTGSLYEGALFLEDFTDFVDIALSDPPAAPERSSRGTTPPADFCRVEFDGVGFTYPSHSEPSLAGVSLAIDPGEVVALVGENGSGKTTLTKLLAGLYRPTEGAIRWDGVDVTSDDDRAEIRKHVAVIFQDFARYFLTARENVGISRTSDINERDRIRDAALKAGADAFLSALPSGYDSLLGPAFVGGSDLSTGQWQRVALARAYFRDAPMLILDEPTAALDPRGEYEIFQQVRRLAKGRTVVLVSHRFSSVRGADRIFVLDGGRIVEEGDHRSLVERGGLYAELFELQAEGYRGAAS